MFIRGLWSLWAEKKWRKMDIHARAAVWLVNFKDFFLSSIFVHLYTVRWSLYQGVYNDNLVTHLNIPQRCAAMYLLSTAKLLLHWAISISGWLAGPPPFPWKPSSYQSISQWQPLAHFLSCLLFIILFFAFSSQHILIFCSVISSQWVICPMFKVISRWCSSQKILDFVTQRSLHSIDLVNRMCWI